MQTKPTLNFYADLQAAYDFFNVRLFDNALPNCLLTVQREKNTMGFFSANRWVGPNDPTHIHEIAINPAYLANYKALEVLQTLVHEQCHLWQFVHGTPSQSTYHNSEWANKMESIGLMPSSTGALGGKRTGQRMADYALDGGNFLKASVALVNEGKAFQWLDRHAKPYFIEPSLVATTDTAMATLYTSLSALKNDMSLLQPPLASKTKTKYFCSGCSTNLWGKPNLRIRCEDCSELFAIS